MKYFYTKVGDCYEFVSPHIRTCQLHGEFIGMEVKGNKIKKSGKLSNITSSIPVSLLTVESLDWLSLTYPVLKVKESL